MRTQDIPYKDRTWYWVEYDEGWGQPPTIQPAMYRAKTDDWQSAQFFDLSTRFLTVLEPCARVQELEASEPALVCYEAYQVVGDLLNQLGLFGTEQATKILDNLSQARMVHDDVLPWEVGNQVSDINVVDMPKTQQKQALAIPEGWQLVPIEPTSAMVAEACSKTHEQGYNPYYAYKAMLTAAPQPEKRES